MLGKRYTSSKTFGTLAFVDENTKQELAKISAALSKALETSTPEEWRAWVERAINRIDDLVVPPEKHSNKTHKKP